MRTRDEEINLLIKSGAFGRGNRHVNKFLKSGYKSCKPSLVWDVEVLYINHISLVMPLSYGIVHKCKQKILTGLTLTVLLSQNTNTAGNCLFSKEILQKKCMAFGEWPNIFNLSSSQCSATSILDHFGASNDESLQSQKEVSVHNVTVLMLATEELMTF